MGGFSRLRQFKLSQPGTDRKSSDSMLADSDPGCGESDCRVSMKELQCKRDGEESAMQIWLLFVLWQMKANLQSSGIIRH